MKVEINRRVTEVAPEIQTLRQLLDDEHLSGPGRAVAVDGRVVRRDDLDDTYLTDGMRITVIRATCGG